MFNFINELKVRYQKIIHILKLVDEKIILIDQKINAQDDKIINIETKINQNNLGKEYLLSIKSDGEDINSKISDIRNRMEFIREEMMFEMRLKTNSLTDKRDNKSITKKIISSTKLNDSAMRRINLGCGHIQPEGYINVDARELPGVDVVCAADDLAFDDSSLEEIYASHLIEHFTELELKRKIFPHWLSKIKSGGCLRLVTPDADSMINDYVSGVMSFEDLRKVTYGAQDYEGDFHYTMFSVESLNKLLSEAGFAQVKLVENNRRNGLCREMEILAIKQE